MPTYSFGAESPLKFQVPDKVAKHYNAAVDEWLAAQGRFTQTFGRKWNPKRDPIGIDWTPAQHKAWDRFAHIYKNALKKDGPFYTGDILDDFLVKNTKTTRSLPRSNGEHVLSGLVQLTFERRNKWVRTVGAFAMAGALYGLLRGR